MPNTLLPLLALSLSQLAAAADLGTDACAALVPPALANKLATEFSGYQLPNSSDSGDERSRALNKSGDWPCPFVVLADFDGNGELDRALLLKARDAGIARLIGAVNNKGQWQVSLSEDWPLALADSELRPKEAGFYQREDAIKQPVEQLDQLASLQAEYPAFTAGRPDSPYAIYALVNGKWQKLSLQE